MQVTRHPIGAPVKLLGAAAHLKIAPQTGVIGPVAEHGTRVTAVHETLSGSQMADPVTVPTPKRTSASTLNIEMWGQQSYPVVQLVCGETIVHDVGNAVAGDAGNPATARHAAPNATLPTDRMAPPRYRDRPPVSSPVGRIVREQQARRHLSYALDPTICRPIPAG